MEENNNEQGLSLLDIFNIIKRRIIGIIISVVVLMIAGLGYAILTDKTTYHATTSVYVIYDNGKADASTDSINYGRLASKTFAEALKDDKMWKLIYNKANENLQKSEDTNKFEVPSYIEIGKSISASYDSDLQSLRFSFTYSSSDNSLIIPMTNAVIDVLEDLTHKEADEYKNAFNCFNLSILGDTVEDDIYATSKSKIKTTLIFAMIGLVVGFGYAFIAELLSQTLRSKEQLEDICDIKVIGTIPNVNAVKKKEGDK